MSKHHIAIKEGAGQQWNAGFIYAAAHCSGVPFEGIHYGYDSPEDEKAHKVSRVAKIDCDDAVWDKFQDVLKWRYSAAWKGYPSGIEILD